MHQAAANCIGSAVLLLGIAWAWYLTGQFEQAAARYYPYAVLAFTAIVGLLWLLRSVHRWRSAGATQAGEEGNGALGSRAGYVLLAGTVVYGVLVVQVGYVLPSIAYIAATALALGGRRWLSIGIVAILFPLAIYLGLVYGFYRPLPF